jgi:beta-1,4-glucosyltransferase
LTDFQIRPNSIRSVASYQTPFPVHNVLGVPISVISRRNAIDYLLTRLSAKQTTLVCFANTHLLMCLSAHPRSVSLLNGFLVLNDGLGIDIASALLCGRGFPENLNGTDFTPMLLRSLPRNTRVFLYGARPDVLAITAKYLVQRYACVVCGSEHGFSGRSPEEIAFLAKSASPDVVLVALGNPLQEEWVSNHASFIAAPLILAVGAFFDFASGAVPRAPSIMRRLRLEWLYRWAQEPGRLRRRYTVELARFYGKVLQQKYSALRSNGNEAESLTGARPDARGDN